MLFKRPEDCFDCFNRVPSVKYSTVQYPQYETKKYDDLDDNYFAVQFAGDFSYCSDAFLSPQKETSRLIYDTRDKQLNGRLLN